MKNGGLSRTPGSSTGLQNTNTLSPSETSALLPFQDWLKRGNEKSGAQKKRDPQERRMAFAEVGGVGGDLSTATLKKGQGCSLQAL
ncbi:hypothetical protein EYF80_019244 [Liparis tanakae]|uniref:Uncharacterized protein n=1 Tax=Liparis tanakae TaxID=230148 RepID=A0A4Z2HXC8_9TELE|nr:hypothetical protein EYF80_019244 [Liparis tanakae]